MSKFMELSLRTALQLSYCQSESSGHYYDFYKHTNSAHSVVYLHEKREAEAQVAELIDHFFRLQSTARAEANEGLFAQQGVVMPLVDDNGNMIPPQLYTLNLQHGIGGTGNTSPQPLSIFRISIKDFMERVCSHELNMILRSVMTDGSISPDAIWVICDLDLRVQVSIAFAFSLDYLVQNKAAVHSVPAVSKQTGFLNAQDTFHLATVATKNLTMHYSPSIFTKPAANAVYEGLRNSPAKFTGLIVFPKDLLPVGCYDDLEFPVEIDCLSIQQ